MGHGDAKKLKRLLAMHPDPLALAAELCAAYRELVCDLEDQADFSVEKTEQITLIERW